MIFAKGTRLNREDVEAWYGRGISQISLRRHKDVIKSFDQAIMLDPGHAEAWHEKGLALQALGREEEANAAFAKAEMLGFVLDED